LSLAEDLDCSSNSFFGTAPKNIKLETATASEITTIAAAATRIQLIQFNLLMWRLNSAGPIKIPTTDIPQ